MDEKVGMQDGITHHLNKMYQDWFLDYASYVILERAVPCRISAMASSPCNAASSTR